MAESVEIEFGLKLWLRYKDDIFYIIDAEHEKRLEFVHMIRRRSVFPYFG